MKKNNANWFMILFLCLLTVLITSCVPKTYRTHSEFETRIAKINSPGLLPPDVKVYEVSAGGVPELRDEWCTIGKSNVIKCLGENFQDKNCKIKHIEIDEALHQELEDIQALYRAVDASIRAHTYEGPNKFPEKIKNFEYSLGPIKNILDKLGIDALVFFYGSDQISSGGRKAIMAASVIAGALVGIQVTPVGGMTTSSIAIVDSTGTILWFNSTAVGGAFDLRDYDSTAGLIVQLIDSLPEFRK